MSKSSDKPDPSQDSQARAPYVVLARKYRPQSFEDLIGQDIMVRTLSNAFEMDRIAQAYMLTGVRGVGKTTTARILARALNYERPGVADRPTLDIKELGAHCQAIMESRHVDVLEMDAASNTGIDDIREIIEAIRYKPASARYRVFIVDEVHMLSKAAFNGLLKTLEEPPPHAKFIFATTEIRKVPVTILSRCQRFDLRRVDAALLERHFAGILEKEGHTAGEGALALIARAAEGSVRDGLSLLDQALTLGQGHLTPAGVLEMLGLSGRAAIFDLLERIFEGDAPAALASLNTLHDTGSDPLMILTDAADAVHALSRLKAVPGIYPPDFSSADKARADKLSGGDPGSPARHRLADAAQGARRSVARAEAVRRRRNARYPHVLHGAASIARRHHWRTCGQTCFERWGGTPRHGAGPAAAPSPVQAQSEAPRQPQSRTPRFGSFEDVVAYAAEVRDIKLKSALEEKVELVKFGPGFIELHTLDGAPQNIAQELSRKMQAWTGERWIVSLSEQRGLEPLGARRRAENAQAVDDIRKHPVVKSVMHHFPDAEIKGVRKLD